jgi:hypothetical protein
MKAGMFSKSPLASTSYSQFQKIDEITLKKNGIKYSEQMKKEQKKLNLLINMKFPSYISDNMVTLMRVSENVFSHTDDDYKFVDIKSAEFQKLTIKENFILIGCVKEMKDFFNSITI